MKMKEKGFALIDTMIAALILAVAAVAYIKLQNVSLQRSVKVNYSLQATQTITSVMEVMRATPGMASWLLVNKGGNMKVESVVPSKVVLTKCGSSAVSLTDSSTWCNASDINKDNFSLLQRMFSENFKGIDDLAIFCMNRDVVSLNKYRLTVIWKNASNVAGIGNYTPVTAADCPATYASDYSARVIGGKHPDRGYVSLHTWLK